MNIREHARKLYDNWFNNGQLNNLFDAVIWPICAELEKMGEKADASQCETVTLSPEDRSALDAYTWAQLGADAVKADAGPAPNEEAVRAALHYAYNHHTDEEKRLLRNIEPHGDLHPWVPAMQILAAEVRRLREALEDIASGSATLPGYSIADAAQVAREALREEQA